MGTSSFNGYECSPGKTYEQLKQFDGNPNWQGKKFYETIIKTLMESPKYFGNRKPNIKFFRRIRHFLKELQWASSHSYGVFCEATMKEWGKEKSWEYIFDKNGNFMFSSRCCSYTCIIPWEFTSRLVRAFSHFSKSPLDPFWEFMDTWTGQTTPPVLRLNTFLVHAFPKQGDEGWRMSGILTVKRKKTYSMFTNQDYKKQNKKKLHSSRVIFKSDYLTVKKCSLKKLPILIGSLTNEEAIDYLQRRLKDGK